MKDSRPLYFKMYVILIYYKVTMRDRLRSHSVNATQKGLKQSIEVYHKLNL